MRKRTHDLAIIGGGITGSAIAYGLAAKGITATVLDTHSRVHMASRTNVGLIWCQSKFLHLPQYAQWGFLSARLFPKLIKELESISGLKIPVNFTGGLIPVLSEEEYQTRHDYIEKLRSALGEYKGHMIGRNELAKKLPRIIFGPDVCGAAWCEEDGVVDPLILLRSFHQAFPKMGINFFAGTNVHEIVPQKSGYRLLTSQGIIECQRLILAAGLGNRKLTRFAMPSLPVFPDKGQVLLVERMPYVMPIPILGVTQTFGGTTIIGFRHERAGHNTEVIPESVRQEGIWAMRVWPELAKKRIIRSWSGLRVMPDDKMAIYSQLPGHPNVLLATTHSAVTMAAAHAYLLPDFFLGGPIPEIASGMTLERF